MTAQLKPAIVRIWNQKGEIKGAGVLVGSRQIITCAHVVRDALGLSSTPENPPEQKIKLDFPFPAQKKYFWAQVRVWKPRQDDDSGDIAGLEITDSAPMVSRPIPLINVDDISKLSGHTCKAYGFPTDTGVWSYGNVIQEERIDGTVQLTNSHTTGHRIRKGFSGGPIWDDELNGLVGITSLSDNDYHRKVAFMLPTKVILNTWPELTTSKQNSNTTTMEIPFAILAMTEPQSQQLLDGDIFNGSDVTQDQVNHFTNRKESLEHDGIVDIRESYGSAPEEWKPHGYQGLSIEQVIWNELNHHNEEHRHPSKPILLPKFITEGFSKAKIHQTIRLFERQGGIIIIDAISLHHPQIYKELSGSGLLSHKKIAILILSPIIAENILINNKLVQQVLSPHMNSFFNRFEKQCDLSCEIGIGDISVFKRWFIHSLHKVAENKLRAHKSATRKIRKEIESNNSEGFWELEE